MAHASRIGRIMAPVLLLSGVSGACLNGPAFLPQKSSATMSHTLPERQLVVVQKTADGGFAAVIDPTSKIPQTLEAGAGSSIEGTSVTFPPGSLAIATQITLREGVPIADRLREELGLGESKIVGDKTPVEMESSTPVNGMKAFEIAIRIPDTFGLTQASDRGLALFYSLNDASNGTKIEGVFLASTGSLRVEGGKVYFQVPNFGNYHLVRLDPVPTQQPAPIVKYEARIALQSLRPYVAPAGATIEVQGANFRPTMKLAIGSVPVTSVKLKSDTAATFAMPAEVPFGFNELRAEQGGDGTKLKLFAQAKKDALPLITIAPGGVCEGVEYYDANGDKQTGTMTCAGNTATSAETITETITEPSPSDFYDKDGDGVVDYATGTEGSSVTAASTLSLPGDGSFYKVTGNATTNAISSAPAGTRVTLMFTGNVTLVPSPGGSAGGLYMHRNRGYTTRPSDVFEFVSIGPGAWREVSRSVTATRVVARIVNGHSIPNQSNGFALKPDQEVMDALGEYDPTTGIFMPVESGMYLLTVSMKLINASFPNTSCSGGMSNYTYLYDNGVITGSHMNQTSGCMAGYRLISYSSQVPMTAGRAYTIRTSFYNGNDDTPAILAAHGQDALVIERAD